MSGSFLEELKRRRVYRVGVGYVAAAFVVLQGADLVFPALGMGSRAFQVLVVATLAGFPVALVVAWVFDLTPGGLVRTPGDAEPDSEGGARTPVLAWAVALGVSTLVLAASGWWFLRTADEALARPAAQQVAPDAKSLAVLPFVNLSGDAEQDYFSDGITDAVITALSRVRTLRVASRTSSFAFKNRSAPVQEIGQTLGVASVLEGSVRKSDETVYVDIRLADTRDGFEVWTERYERPLTDVFAVQEEIAQAIVRVLEVTLAERPDTPMVPGTTTDAMAYDKHLWGEYNRQKRSPAGFDDAIGNYEDALMRDSTFAPAWAGLARSLVGRAQFPGVDRNALLTRADSATERGLALGTDLGSVHAARGLVLFEHLHRWDEAEAELRRAIQIEPQSASHKQQLALLLALRDRPTAARALADSAVDLNPLSPGSHADRATVLQALGDGSAAEAAFRRALEIDPTFASAYFGLEFLLVAEGRPEEAFALSESRRERGGVDRRPPGVAASGNGPAIPASLQEYLSGFEARARAERAAGSSIRAPTLAAIGQEEEALATLREAQDAGALSPLALLRCLAVPGFRTDPEVRSFLSELGLTEP